VDNKSYVSAVGIDEDRQAGNQGGLTIPTGPRRAGREALAERRPLRPDRAGHAATSTATHLRAAGRVLRSV